MICQTCHTDNLTTRETSVAALIAEGLSNHQIAGRLFLADSTVKNVTAMIMQKLGFNNRTQIAIWVIRREVAA
jgi:DNA-binding NarL/FixJ family response regulator